MTTDAAHDTAPDNVVTLPIPDDDEIPVVTGIPAIDMDPAVIARRLRDKPWEDRARFFNNIFVESLERVTQMQDYLDSDEDHQKHFDWALASIQNNLGNTLSLFGVERPDNDLSAGLCLLALDPMLRRAGRGYFKGPGLIEGAFFEAMQQWEGLRVLFNLIRVTCPAAGVAWRLGVPDDPDVLFHLPDEPLAGGAS